MKFGQVDNPAEIDFTIPKDHPDTRKVLAKSKAKDMDIRVGCAKWNKTDLKNFYPKGTKDELGYYTTQFNCIELNATFYRPFPPKQYEKWNETTPASDYPYVAEQWTSLCGMGVGFCNRPGKSDYLR